MGIKRLRKLLKKSDDKFSVFIDENLFNKYVCTIQEILDLLKDFFSDAEILKLLEFPPFQNLKTVNRFAIMTIITDSEIMIQMLKNDSYIEGMEIDQIVDLFVNSLKAIAKEKRKNKKVETLICEGDGLGIQNKISY